MPRFRPFRKIRPGFRRHVFGESRPWPGFSTRLREATRRLHYIIRTKENHGGWARRFILDHDRRHPREMGELEVAASLNHLAAVGRLVASIRKQACSVRLFPD